MTKKNGRLSSISIALILATVPLAQASTGKAFNPDISVNFLGLTQQGNEISNSRGADSHNGTELQEAELQIFSDVDPYLRANVLLSISPNGVGVYGIVPEEVYAESTFLPSLTLRAGKFKAAFGKHNTLHTHAFPFIDAPLINQILFGTEGLNEAGISASYILPTSWYTEFTVQALGTNNSVFYNSAQSGDFSQVAQFKNLWDLSEEATLEWSVYGTQGPNQFSQSSTAYGSDLIIKWRPSEGGKYQALWWANEFIGGNRSGANVTPANLSGLATWLQYQLAERWWMQTRFEYVGIAHSVDFTPETKESFLIGFFPSEFSGFRVQFDHLAQAGISDGYAAAVQYNITIGAHPAHSY